jgi:hypothetical protein
MDLITDLPLVTLNNGIIVDMILSIVDHGLMKGVILTPCLKTLTEEGTSEILLHHIYKQFGLPHISVISILSSPRKNSMTCPNPSHGTMLLSSYQMQTPPRAARFTLYLSWSRKNLMSSSRRTLTLATSVPPNPQWLLQSSLSKRSAVASDSYRTTGH